MFPDIVGSFYPPLLGAAAPSPHHSDNFNCSLPARDEQQFVWRCGGRETGRGEWRVEDEERQGRKTCSAGEIEYKYQR